MMMLKAPLHFFKLSRGQLLARLDRLAEEASENEGMAEHAAKAVDPIRWESGRLERSGGTWYYVAADETGPALHVTPRITPRTTWNA
ncbi:MAG: hypothetical protein WDN06_08680 [Asticcacaulis sp.]